MTPVAEGGAATVLLQTGAEPSEDGAAHDIAHLI